MSTTKDFNPIKRKLYLAYHQDGILDMVAGATVLGFGTFMLTTNVVFLILGAIAASQYILLKQRITIPRFGYVRFISEKKSMKQATMLLGIGVFVLLLFFLLPLLMDSQPTSSEIQAWLQRYHMVPLSGLLFGLPALVAAIFLGLKRFYLYAILAVGLPALGAWLNIETFIPIIATGLVIVAIGIWLLADFMKKHPVTDEAGDHANG